jgi:hypothetical protein
MESKDRNFKNELDNINASLLSNVNHTNTMQQWIQNVEESGVLSRPHYDHNSDHHDYFDGNNNNSDINDDEEGRRKSISSSWAKHLTILLNKPHKEEDEEADDEVEDMDNANNEEENDAKVENSENKDIVLINDGHVVHNDVVAQSETVPSDVVQVEPQQQQQQQPQQNHASNEVRPSSPPSSSKTRVVREKVIIIREKEKEPVVLSVQKSSEVRKEEVEDHHQEEEGAETKKKNLNLHTTVNVIQKISKRERSGSVVKELTDDEKLDLLLRKVLEMTEEAAKKRESKLIERMLAPAFDAKLVKAARASVRAELGVADFASDHHHGAAGGGGEGVNGGSRHNNVGDLYVHQVAGVNKCLSCNRRLLLKKNMPVPNKEEVNIKFDKVFDKPGAVYDFSSSGIGGQGNGGKANESRDDNHYNRSSTPPKSRPKSAPWNIHHKHYHLDDDLDHRQSSLDDLGQAGGYALSNDHHQQQLHHHHQNSKKRRELDEVAQAASIITDEISFGRPMSGSNVGSRTGVLMKRNHRLTTPPNHNNNNSNSHSNQAAILKSSSSGNNHMLPIGSGSLSSSVSSSSFKVRSGGPNNKANDVASEDSQLALQQVQRQKPKSTKFYGAKVSASRTSPPPPRM